MTLNVAYIVDTTRSRPIFQEWSRLLLEEMDATSPLARTMRPVVDVMFRYVYTADKKRDFDAILAAWFLYHMEKDSWYSFRNRYPSLRLNQVESSPCINTVEINFDGMAEWILDQYIRELEKEEVSAARMRRSPFQT